MAVNGIEIAVGQVWRTRGGAELTIRRHDPTDDEHPWLASADDESYWLAPSGQLFLSRTDDIDIVELIKDEHGFTIWRGGAVLVKLRDGTETSDPVDSVWMRWSHTDTVGDTVAYKVAAVAPLVGDEHEALTFHSIESDPNGLASSEPGAKLDAGKNRLGLVLGDFSRALQAVGEVGTFGAEKYTDHGWVSVANGQERYTDALFRHLLVEAAGEPTDPQTNLLHAAHVAWNALARLDLMIRAEGGAQ